MRDKIIRIIKTMRTQAAIDNALGEKRCSFCLNDYADQLAETVRYNDSLTEAKEDTEK